MYIFALLTTSFYLLAGGPSAGFTVKLSHELIPIPAVEQFDVFKNLAVTSTLPILCYRTNALSHPIRTGYE